MLTLLYIYIIDHIDNIYIIQLNICAKLSWRDHVTYKELYGNIQPIKYSTNI